MSILVISNHNSFRVLFDKIASVYFFRKMYLYFSIGNDQPRKPALCQLYRPPSFPIAVMATRPEAADSRVVLSSAA